MGPIDAVWHLLNFVAPALVTAALAAALAKLVWRRDLAAASWLRLTASAATLGAAALMAGLLLSGRDGRMATYLAMAAAMALALWWTGFRPRRR